MKRLVPGLLAVALVGLSSTSGADEPAVAGGAPPAASPAPAAADPSPAGKPPDAPATTGDAAGAPVADGGGFMAARTRKEKNIPDWRFVFNNLVVFRWNPLGLEDQMRVGLQKKLYQSYDTMFRDNFIHFGIYPRVNPAFVKLGPSIEIQPMSIFNLRLAVEYVGFFGTFGFFQSFESPTSNYSDSRITELRKEQDAAGNPNKNMPFATSGMHAMIEPLIQLKVGPIAIRNKLMIEYWRMNLRENDRVFFDVTLDTLVPNNGWILANDLDLLWVSKYKVTLGLRYSTVRPLYEEKHFKTKAEQAEFDKGTGEEVATAESYSGVPANGVRKVEYGGNGHHRLGLIAAYTFFDRGFTKFNKPSILLIASWYLNHRYRTGLDVQQYMPYIILGFAFQSDALQ